ncbi:hypothetical protein [Oceanobacillus caeni]|uniref:hypothetical protein n=1 Tax=Oceanobacillus caeni TaxID=405946 RepID=UPI0036D2C2C7
MNRTLSKIVYFTDTITGVITDKTHENGQGNVRKKPNTKKIAGANSIPELLSAI